MAFVHPRTPTLARAAAAEQHSRALAVLRLLSLATSSGSISKRLQANCKLSGPGLHMPSMNTHPTTTVVPTLASEVAVVQVGVGKMSCARHVQGMLAIGPQVLMPTGSPCGYLKALHTTPCSLTD